MVVLVMLVMILIGVSKICQPLQGWLSPKSQV